MLLNTYKQYKSKQKKATGNGSPSVKQKNSDNSLLLPNMTISFIFFRIVLIQNIEYFTDISCVDILACIISKFHRKKCTSIYFNHMKTFQCWKSNFIQWWPNFHYLHSMNNMGPLLISHELLKQLVVHILILDFSCVKTCEVKCFSAIWQSLITMYLTVKTLC